MSPPDFKLVLTSHAGLFARIASTYELNPALQQDLLQNIAIAVWKALPAWRGDASIKTFVARVAHNQGVKHVIEQRRNPARDALDPEWVDDGADPEGDAARLQLREQLFVALQSLPLPMRQVVMLSLEGFGPGEIADVLGISANLAAVRLSRGRQQLQQSMRPRP